MLAEGLIGHYPMERLAVMGFTEPLKRLPELLRMRARLFRYFRQRRPALFVGIDAPDFNLGLELRLRRCRAAAGPAPARPDAAEKRRTAPAG